MAIVLHDCPHCGAGNAAFELVHGSENDLVSHRWWCTGICPGCHDAILLKIDSYNGTNPAAVPANISGNLFTATFAIRGSWPERPPIGAPAHVPERVAKAFTEGSSILHVSPTAACMQFRRALEFGLKDLAPEVEAWRLEKRIDKLADAGLLTQSLKEWAHHLRLDGNDAVHADDPTLEHARSVQQLTRYVLTYLYTLPKSIDAARDPH